ncbi:glucose sorbosone dehydrogenase [Leptobacterium flavescens]|uniref:Glucose sorbosone dehydrogenase n=1 Tax=Leptobacterium flavescens TaxID=472055 RepID=A0A6P0US45_9FLAO|nr:PQQ-dependent sugar dehydrogenase [Leptobacterium flavescens]NER13693.1 glucose sorbosone dehydrogenase [Leptobacterium flavescens]
MKTLLNYWCLLCMALFISCNGSSSDDDGTPTDDEGTTPGMTVTNAFAGLNFNRPVDLQSPNDNTDRIFVVEQRGVIRVFNNEADTTTSSVFLDIQSIVNDSDNEMGLLAMAFHPDYANNGYFYVNYTGAAGASFVSRFQVSATNANAADDSSELVLLTIPQPFTNHNGGQLAFGPDGFLYIASGDGGSGGDPQGNAQNRANLLGAILRIDVDQVSQGLNYAIPADNPFVNDNTARGEIFAYGLRNPWRMSFDTQTGTLWVGDVGQGNFEEIDIIESGNNYGWNILEGNDCFQANTCNQNGLTAPVFVYNHSNGDLSVTGGYVYRGSSLPSLQGQYIYADFVSGRIWGLTLNQDNSVVNDLIIDTGFNISSFGTDNNNELFICGFDGNIYKLEMN